MGFLMDGKGVSRTLFLDEFRGASRTLLLDDPRSPLLLTSMSMFGSDPLLLLFSPFGPVVGLRAGMVETGIWKVSFVRTRRISDMATTESGAPKVSTTYTRWTWNACAQENIGPGIHSNSGRGGGGAPSLFPKPPPHRALGAGPTKVTSHVHFKRHTSNAKCPPPPPLREGRGTHQSKPPTP